MNEFNTNPKITDNRVRYELDGLKRSDPKRGDLYIQILMEAQLFGEPEQPRILSNNARLDLIKFVRDLDPEGMEVVQSEVEERKKERLQSPAPRKPKALTPQQVQANRDTLPFPVCQFDRCNRI